MAENDVPAFPVSLPGWGDNGASGMTLRDYFAAKALVALMSRPDAGQLDTTENIAAAAYMLADDMLAAREVRKP